jgi:myo-inositol-1(or 4)-monophosphatase
VSAPADDAWLAAASEIVAGIEAELHARPRRADRDAKLGRGEGGDVTTAIDRAAEDVAVAVMERMAAAGASFTLLSEELGERRFGGGASSTLVVLDPIDGSLNCKRGLPWFAVSLAVADGPAYGDVRLGVVHDFGSGERFTARRGGGAAVGARPLGGERPKDVLELVALEATKPDLLARAAGTLPTEVERVRVIGSLALALCEVAAGRLDAAASLRPRGARSVDIAAAQLVVREAGCAFTLPDDPLPALEQPLDLRGRSRVFAAGDAATCERLQLLVDGGTLRP